MSGELTQPKVDQYIHWLSRDDHFGMHGCVYDDKSDKLLDEFFELIDQIAPVSKNGVRALWLRAERGPIEDYGNAEEEVACGDFDSVEQFIEEWKAWFPDEIKWYQLQAVQLKDEGYRAVMLGHKYVIVQDKRREPAGFPNEIPEFVQWLIEGVKECIEMLKSGTYNDFIKLCFEAHRNQTDKSGLPYVFHPFHVAEQMPDEETTIVALLHDVIEDTAYTIDDLRKMGFSEEVLDALDLMTHDKNVPYMEYVAKISENEIARTVKLADLRHNSDLTRLDEIDDKARNRIEKYKAAIRLLSESKTSFCPYYDKGTDTWRVDFPDRDSEEGDLLYVASEYARTGLYYPYNVAVTAGKEYSGHAHSFEGVIQALLDDPAGFSIAGFEEFYSKQEQEMLLDIRNKLMNTEYNSIIESVPN